MLRLFCSCHLFLWRRVRCRRLGETLPHLSINADSLSTYGVVNHSDTLTKHSSTVTPMSPPHPRRMPGKDTNDTVSFFIKV